MLKFISKIKLYISYISNKFFRKNKTKFSRIIVLRCSGLTVGRDFPNVEAIPLNAPINESCSAY